jgi:hypothetical protein
MTPEQPKSKLAHVPAILAGSAALIAALSTVYVNMRNAPAPTATPAASFAPALSPASGEPAASPAATESPKPAAAQRVLLRLERVQVDNDGSMGSTDWTFEASVDGEPMFTVAMPSLNDKPGQNLARPADARQASVEVKLPPGKNVALAVHGFRTGWVPGSHAEVSGQAWLAQGIEKAAVTLKNDKPKGPQFVLYFSAAPTE